MQSNAFIPSQLILINQVLSELGRLPVDIDSTDNSALLIRNRLNVLLPELLLRCNWRFAIKYVTDGSPLLTNFSPQYVYTYQLPSDFGRIWKFWEMWYDYDLIDTYLLSNQKPVNYYYVVNNVDYNIIWPLFQRALVLYCASDICLTLTENAELTKWLETKYERKLADAILQNDMERSIQANRNDFDRFSYI